MKPNTVHIRAVAEYNQDDVDTAIRSMIDAMGGIAKFVKPGQTVVLKPNLVIGADPKKATTTHPTVVSAVAKLCVTAGAAKVTIFDSPGGPFTKG